MMTLVPRSTPRYVPVSHTFTIFVILSWHEISWCISLLLNFPCRVKTRLCRVSIIAYILIIVFWSLCFRCCCWCLLLDSCGVCLLCSSFFRWVHLLFALCSFPYSLPVDFLGVLLFWVYYFPGCTTFSFWAILILYTKIKIQVQ